MAGRVRNAALSAHGEERPVGSFYGRDVPSRDAAVSVPSAARSRRIRTAATGCPPRTGGVATAAKTAEHPDESHHVRRESMPAARPALIPSAVVAAAGTERGRRPVRKPQRRPGRRHRISPLAPHHAAASSTSHGAATDDGRVGDTRRCRASPAASKHGASQIVNNDEARNPARPMRPGTSYRSHRRWLYH